MIIVLMGVSGSGKTTIGEALAARLRWRFLDADEFHPAENVEKMRTGHALTDADRGPWLSRIRGELAAIMARGESAVLACSALKEAYRNAIAGAGDVRFVHLAGDYATIDARLAERHHRYMPATLLASQFETLEIPRNAVALDIRMSVDEQVSAIIDTLVPAEQRAS